MTRLRRQAAGDDGGVELYHYVVALKVWRIGIPRGAGGAGIEVLGDHLSLLAPQGSGREVVQQVRDRRAARLLGLGLALHEEILFLEAPAGPVQQRFNRAFGDFHLPRDVRVAQTLELAQRQHEPVFLREPPGYRPHGIPQLADLECHLGALAGVRIRHLEDGVFVLLVVDLLGLRALLATSPLVVAGVGGDPVDPCREVEAVVDAMDRPENLEEGLLGQVFGQLPVAQQAEGQAIDGLVVAPEERIEGGHIACEIVADQIEIRGPPGNSRHYPEYHPDSAKSFDVRSLPPSRGRIIAPSLARPATLSEAFSNFVTRPRSFRRSSAIRSL